MKQDINDEIRRRIQQQDEEKRKEEIKRRFESLAKPLIDFLCAEYHPHAKIIIDQTSAEVVAGEMAFVTEEFLRD